MVNTLIKYLVTTWGRIFLAIAAIGAAMITPSRADAPAAPAVLRADETGLLVEWRLPPYAQTAQGGFSRITMEPLAVGAEPGYPQLPGYTAMLGLPPAGGARIVVLELEQETATLLNPPLPAPSPVMAERGQAGMPAPAEAGRTIIAPNPAVYAADAFFPAAVVQLDAPAQIRQQRVARLRLNPVQVNPVTGQLRVTRAIRFEVVFEQPAPSGLSRPVAADLFTRTLGRNLLNPASAGWQIPPADAPARPAQAQIAPPVVKITVNQSGLYQLTYADLQAAGLPVTTLDPRTLQLTYGVPARSVAIQVEGQADGRFDPPDKVLFYARPQFSRYTDDDVYLLGFGGEAGLRMQNQFGGPAGLSADVAYAAKTMEENHFYDSRYAARDGDRWYWAELDGVKRKTAFTATVQLDPPLATTGNVTVTVWFNGLTRETHRLQMWVNGALAGEVTGYGKNMVEQSLAVSANKFAAVNNQIGFVLPGSDALWLDALRITYPVNQAASAQLEVSGPTGHRSYALSGWGATAPQVFNVTNPASPAVVSGATFSGGQLTVGNHTGAPVAWLVVPPATVKAPKRIGTASLLTDPPAGADYIIITHPDFAEAIAPLAQRRADQGLRVATVNVNAVYDTFGGGRPAAEAIAAFLRHAYQAWTPPAPVYVLLVGDGHYDFKNHFGWGRSWFIPPYLAQVDPWLGETAADNRYVTLPGGDNLPDMLIGRLPVNSAAETSVVVDKIIRYETAPVPGGWNARHVFVSDNWQAEKGDLNFYIEADSAYNKLSQPFAGRRFYFDTTPSSSLTYVYADSTILRRDFLSAFNAGNSIVSYFGHSSWHQWGEEQFLRWSRNPVENDVAGLRNGYRLPVVLEMTCYTGYFHHPEYPTLDESLLVQSGGGAIATWGASGEGLTGGHRLLLDGFYDAVLAGPEADMGSAILAGKTKLYEFGFNQDLLDTFVLLGDPALMIDFTIVPFNHHTYLPVIAR